LIILFEMLRDLLGFCLFCSLLALCFAFAVGSASSLDSLYTFDQNSPDGLAWSAFIWTLQLSFVVLLADTCPLMKDHFLSLQNSQAKVLIVDDEAGSIVSGSVAARTASSVCDECFVPRLMRIF
jgi:hypothetical protein